MIDAAEGRDVATADVPGAFLHSDIDDDTYVIVDGPLVPILLRANKKYAEFVHITKSGKKIIYLKLKKALYGTMKAARLFWENLSDKLKQYGFEPNQYEKCIVTKEINGKQCTVAWHVDDLKISHADPQVVTDVITHLETFYGQLSTTRGNAHTYVGMYFEFPGDGTVKILMTDHLKDAVNDFPDSLDDKVTTPAADHIFTVNPDTEPLSEDQRRLLHKIVAKLLFVSTRGRPDIHIPISFLTSRVTKADKDDWKKLRRLISYIKNTMDLCLTLSAENMNVIKWWVDAAYAVRDDFKSQTGATMSFGRGTIMSKSTKQKLNTKSSTESELVAASDMVSQLIWTIYFLESLGYKVDNATMFQDNQIAMLLEKNGIMSSSKRTKHVNIQYFFIKDRIDNG